MLNEIKSDGKRQQIGDKIKPPMASNWEYLWNNSFVRLEIKFLKVRNLILQFKDLHFIHQFSHAGLTLQLNLYIHSRAHNRLSIIGIRKLKFYFALLLFFFLKLKLDPVMCDDDLGNKYKKETEIKIFKHHIQNMTMRMRWLWKNAIKRCKIIEIQGAYKVIVTRREMKIK